MTDENQREAALQRLREAVGEVLGIVLDDIAQKDDVAGLNAAAGLNAGALKCDLVIEWPGQEIHIFVDAADGDGSEAQKLCTITRGDDVSTTH